MAAFFKDKQGNIFTGVKPGQAVPQGFNEIHANTTDAAVEKHVPKVELQHDGHIIRVQVGETEHPRTAWRSTSSSPISNRSPSLRVEPRRARCTPTATCTVCGRRSSRLRRRSNAKARGRFKAALLLPWGERV